MRLRTFSYLDSELTKRFLAQLEGGAYDEEDHSDTGTRERGLSGEARLGPIAGSGSLGRTSEATVSRTIRQTPESDFTRLDRMLDAIGAPDGVTDLELMDDALWKQLQPGEVLRLQAKIKVPSLFSAASMAREFGQLAGLLDLVGETVDAEGREAMAGLTALDQSERMSVVAHLSGSPRYKFVCRLRRTHLREDVSDLAGVWTVLGTVERHVRSSERYSVLEDMGLRTNVGMGRDERRAVLRDLQKNMPDAVVSSPAAVLTPVAIYR